MKQMTYVPAQPAQPVQVEQKPEPTHEHISAQVAGNAAGGIGATAIVVAGWLMVHGVGHGLGLVVLPWPNPAQVAIGATVIGLLVFGILMFMRNSIDEIYDTAARVEAERYIAELETGIAVRDKRIEQLEAELGEATMQTNVKQLRNADRAQAYVTPDKIHGPAWKDAHTLIVRRWGGQSWARDAMRKAGWTDSQHKAAVDIVVRSGVGVQGSEKAGLQPWDAAATVAQALALLNRYRQATLDAYGSVANHASDAVPDSDANADTLWGRGGESKTWQPTRSS